MAPTVFNISTAKPTVSPCVGVKNSLQKSNAKGAVTTEIDIHIGKVHFELHVHVYEKYAVNR